ncbi:MAG: ATP synthase subunit I [Acidiferrobacterales bacterium]
MDLISVLLGGAIAAVVNVYAARRVFAAPATDTDANEVGARELGRLYRAEFGRLIMTAVLFTTVFVLVKELNVVALLVGFVSVHTIGVIAAMKFVKS